MVAKSGTMQSPDCISELLQSLGARQYIPAVDLALEHVSDLVFTPDRFRTQELVGSLEWIVFRSDAKSDEDIAEAVPPGAVLVLPGAQSFLDPFRR